MRGELHVVESNGARPVVVIAGAGAAGTLTALHLVRSSCRRSTPLEVLLLDPADRWGRGVAFGTPDEEHLLNVPAAGMSALPEDPGHFVAWAGDQGLFGAETEGTARAPRNPNAFLPRRRFGLYLDDILCKELAAADGFVTLRHLRDEATGVVRTASGWAVRRPLRTGARRGRDRRRDGPSAGRLVLGARVPARVRVLRRGPVGTGCARRRTPRSGRTLRRARRGHRPDHGRRGPVA